MPTPKDEGLLEGTLELTRILDVASLWSRVDPRRGDPTHLHQPRSQHGSSMSRPHTSSKSSKSHVSSTLLYLGVTWIFVTVVCSPSPSFESPRIFEVVPHRGTNPRLRSASESGGPSRPHWPFEVATICGEGSP